MKKKFLIAASVAAAFAAMSCSGSGESEKTLIQGSFVGTAPSSVKVTIPEIKLDTTFTVTNGAFKGSVPTCKTCVSVIMADNIGARFIADGTALSFVFDSVAVNITSKTPAKSSHKVYQDFQDGMKALSEQFRKEFVIREVKPGEEQDVTKKYEDLIEQYKKKADSINFAVLAKDKNSINTEMALESLLNSISAAEMDSVIKTLDPVFAGRKRIAFMKQTAERQMATAEGKMFTDFEVDGKKLSDYVGKGKYVLVDFWASWCGPCKMEIPNIKNIYDKYHGDDFDVLSVAVWDKPAATADTAKVYGINWNQIENTQDVATDIYGIIGIPHIILFGPDGTIIKRNLRGEEIEKMVAEYVKAGK